MTSASEEEEETFSLSKSSSFSLWREANPSFAAAIQASAADALLLSCSISDASLVASAALALLSDSISELSFSTAPSRSFSRSASAALASAIHCSALVELLCKVAISDFSISTSDEDVASISISLAFRSSFSFSRVLTQDVACSASVFRDWISVFNLAISLALEELSALSFDDAWLDCSASDFKDTISALSSSFSFSSSSSFSRLTTAPAIHSSAFLALSFRRTTSAASPSALLASNSAVFLASSIFSTLERFSSSLSFIFFAMNSLTRPSSDSSLLICSSFKLSPWISFFSLATSSSNASALDDSNSAVLSASARARSEDCTLSWLFLFSSFRADIFSSSAPFSSLSDRTSDSREEICWRSRSIVRLLPSISTSKDLRSRIQSASFSPAAASSNATVALSFDISPSHRLTSSSNFIFSFLRP
mmetsp:Transcript_21456/g.40351  ORF Transcript_21456/g.40351 Transcript_21456/m.40351 type:complete len:423 (-) Transcript_21456:2026-3294(-)